MPITSRQAYCSDTGTSANLLGYDFAKELGLTLLPTGEKGGGAGGLTHDIFSITELSLQISGEHFAFDSFLAMDFSSIKYSPQFKWGGR